MLISKRDFAGIVAISLNIEDALLETHIENAEQYDLETLIDDQDLLDALQTAKTASTAWTVWTAGTYTTGTIKIHKRKVWVVAAAVNTATEPGTTAGATDWTEKELFTFWRARVRRFLVFATAANFIAEHGLHIAQAGVRVNSANGSIEAAPEDKAILISSASRKREIELYKMMKHIVNKNWVLDGITYSAPSDNVARYRQKSFGVKSVKKRNTNNERNFELNN